MRTFFAPILAAAFAATATFGFASPAHATRVDSCGGIELSANAQCEMRVEGGCTASCEPVNFSVQCAAELYAGCNGGCTAQIDAQCTTSCQGTCEAECQVDPAKFDCNASCRTDCAGSCDAACAGNDNLQCRSSCEATCAGECDASCDVTPASADCQAECQACCNGSCEAEANMSCQVDCQAMGYATCETKLQGGCEAACQKPEGALFCNGNYVDVGDQIDQCVASLEALFQIEVTGYANGNAQCSGNRCTADGEAGFSCATVGPVGQDQGADSGSSGTSLGILGALAAFGLAFGRRKALKK